MLHSSLLLETYNVYATVTIPFHVSYGWSDSEHTKAVWNFLQKLSIHTAARALKYIVLGFWNIIGILTPGLFSL
jgi:hypothetical protein